jgi:D-amino-acid dehydrogenase
VITDGDVAVIGGGIVGTVTALVLQRAGFSVTLLGENEPGAGTAAGSAGYLHDGEIFPLAHVGLLLHLPQLLLDPLGPLILRSSYLPHLARWGTHFLGAMRRSNVEAAIEALGSLNRAAIESFRVVADAADADDLLVYNGGLKVIRDARNLTAVAKELQQLEKVGIQARPLDFDEIHRLAPELGPEVAGGILFPLSAHCLDPAQFGQRIAQRVRLSSTVIRGRATTLTAQSNESWTVSFVNQQRNERIHVKTVVVAAGFGSAALLKGLGYKVPLASARGYHLMIADPHVKPARPMIFHEPHIAATPMLGGVRLAGTMEFALPSAPPDYRRAEMLYNIAQRYIPELTNERTTTWMGVRPLTPDSLPVIGKARNHSRLYYCFGHGHLGLTQAAVSARIISGLLSDAVPAFDMHPFDLVRFN